MLALASDLGDYSQAKPNEQMSFISNRRLKIENKTSKHDSGLWAAMEI